MTVKELEKVVLELKVELDFYKKTLIELQKEFHEFVLKRDVSNFDLVSTPEGEDMRQQLREAISGLVDSIGITAAAEHGTE